MYTYVYMYLPCFALSLYLFMYSMYMCLPATVALNMCIHFDMHIIHMYMYQHIMYLS